MDKECCAIFWLLTSPGQSPCSPNSIFLSPALWLGGTIRMGLSVPSSILLFICHTFVVSTHLQTNHSGDWYQTWWIHSLWYSTYLISLWLCYTKFLLFSGVWFVKQFPHIFRQTTQGICLKLGDTFIMVLHRTDYILIMLHWIPAISCPLICVTVSTHVQTNPWSYWAQILWTYSLGAFPMSYTVEARRKCLSYCRWHFHSHFITMTS